MHVIEVAETTLTFVQAEPPTVTVEPLAKFVPVIAIAVPPADEPEVGDTAVTVGKTPGVIWKSADDALMLDPHGE